MPEISVFFKKNKIKEPSKKRTTPVLKIEENGGHFGGKAVKYFRIADVLSGVLIFKFNINLSFSYAESTII